ncbi:MAG TPA: hypothetical protein VKY65_03240 [Alphaproteobacteria bacterium]|nr:hypothetical protein [Alphaproteobacteria bacterium]
MKKSHRPRLVCLAGAVACLGATVAACDGRLVNSQIPPPGSSTYQDAYLDGCGSGFSDAGRAGYGQDYRRDAARYRGDADYAKGWNDGYRACFEEEQRTPRMVPAF